MSRKLFIGFRIPRKTIDTISMIRSTLNKDDKLFNWSSGNNLHLTLLFIGFEGSSNIKEISDISKKVLSDFNSFNISIEGTGIFSNKRGSQALWLGIKEGAKELKKINYELRSVIEKTLGLKLDFRFTPHITIARKKKKHFHNKIDTKNFMNSVYFPIVLQVDFFTLFESIIINGKIHYKRIDTFDLT
tara:strand:+ start:251 stop:814 length:564 start_codon:yes stop_codon:yes gene_type:complete